MTIENNIPKHDSFIKRALEDKKTAISFFERHLPKEVKEVLKLDSIEAEKESFIENNLKKQISDILFSCP